MPSCSISSNQVAPNSRFAWLDVFRGLAVVFMIEAHVFNSFMLERIQAQSWVSYLSFINGLVAPTFMWIAGFLAGKASLKVQNLTQLGKRLVRCAQIWMIGAFIHAPWGYWLEGDFSAESWRIFLQMNILECMGIALALIYLTGYIGRKRTPEQMAWAFLLLMGAMILAAMPAAQNFGSSYWMGLWVSEKSGSLFPLIPWLPFALGGAASRFWLWDRTKTLPILVGLMGLGIGWYFEPAVFMKSHPAFFFERFGWVLILATSVQFFTTKQNFPWLAHVGQHSLSYYVVHLLILYLVSIGGQTFYQRWGNALDPLHLTIFYFGVLLLCVAVVFVYMGMLRFIQAKLCWRRS